MTTTARDNASETERERERESDYSEVKRDKIITVTREIQAAKLN